MRPFRVTPEETGSDCCIVLSGRRSGAKVRLHGAHLVSWEIDGVDGGTLRLIESRPAAAADDDPSAGGTAVLAPFPGRIFHAKFYWGGRVVGLRPNDSGGHASGGCVAGIPWTVASSAADAEAACVRLEAEWRETRKGGPWPFRFDAALEVELRNLSLAFTLSATNAGRRPMPVGLGLHPFFRLPLTSVPAVDEHALSIAARERWELDDEKIPTGRRIVLEGSEDWRRGRRLGGDTALDEVFGNLEFDDSGRSVCVLRCGTRGRLEVTAGATTRGWAVRMFPPPGGAILLGPQTCATDAFNLAARGIDGGMVVLEPGQTHRLDAEFRWIPADSTIRCLPDDPARMALRTLRAQVSKVARFAGSSHVASRRNRHLPPLPRPRVSSR